KRQKELDARRKALAPVIQQAEAFEAERKKLGDESLRAQAAAAEAAKQAEASKKKLDDAAAKGVEKLKAREQAEAELTGGAMDIATRSKEMDGFSQRRTKAEALLQQAHLSQQQAEQDLKKIMVAEEQARRAELEAQRKAKLEKIAAIGKQVEALKAESARFNATIEPLKELGDAGKPAIKKIEEKQKATQQQIDELQAEAKGLSGEMDKLPVKETGAVKPPAIPEREVKTEKNPAVTAHVATTANSLGMKFAPVGDVQFSVYLTTRKDFEAFATATGLRSEAWRNPGFKQDADHPVVNVTWREAEAFCKWLTEKERKGGLLKSGESYRLPTDMEWSKAVGLPAENGATPEERDMGVPDVYPWGKQWPPPADAGTYAGEETQTEIPIPNYNDGYPNTSPVGKFRANAFGLYDMGGNVWQWVSDYWNSENRAKTLRGGSWYNGAIPLSLLSSCRISSSPDTLHDTYGFRIVKATETGKTRHK
ncbi:MAG: SUMF1/EgtB/PvdO family nonheme iron enzyme, partial [Chthoniobacteraceae bacterium]